MRHDLRDLAVTIGLALLSVGTCVSVGVAASAVPDIIYDAAIEAARVGEFANSVPIIEQRYRENPADLNVAYDYVVVLGWAGRPADAVAAYEALPAGQPPAFVEAAVARNYRDLGQYDKALALYEAGRLRFPADLTFAYGQILTLADAGRANEAIAIGNGLLAARPDDRELLSAMLYAAVASNSPPDILAWANRVLATDPGNREARRQQILQLNQLGAGYRAYELARQSPELFTAEEMRRFGSQYAAALVRWGALPARDETERMANIDRAIAELDRQIAEGAAAMAPVADLLPLRFDRIVALGDRGRTEDVIAAYEGLARDGIEVPGYVLKVVADAYQGRRDPVTARALYQRVLATTPGDFQARIGLFYTEIETEDFPAAFATIDALAADEPRFLMLRGAQPMPNPAWMRAQTTAAMARYYAGDMPEAHRRLLQLVIMEPRNAALRQALGTVLAGRGRLLAAETEFANGLSINPNDVDLLVSRADVAISMGDRADGAERLADLRRSVPANRGVQRLADRLDVINSPQAILRLNSTFQDTGLPIGGDNFGIDVQLYSAPINNSYRLYAGYGLATGSLPEGNVVNHHAAFGLEYTGRNIAANGEITQDTSPRVRIGGRAALGWVPTDRWRFVGTAQLFSSETPLRAIKNGIKADSFGLRASYAASERESYSALGQFVTFSDGNERTVVDVNTTRRLITFPHLTLDGVADLYASANSSTSGPYFSPKSDFAPTLSLIGNQILYRRYSYVYSHNFGLTAGEYWQDGFAGQFLGALTYEQRLRLNDRWEASLGVRLRRQSYDGGSENSLSLFGGLDWRFW